MACMSLNSIYPADRSGRCSCPEPHRKAFWGAGRERPAGSAEAVPPVPLLHTEPAPVYLDTFCNAAGKTGTHLRLNPVHRGFKWQGPLDFNYYGKGKSFQMNFLLYALP